MKKVTTDMNGVFLSSDRGLLDESFIYRYLHDNMYWAKSLTFEGCKRAIQHSAVVFGVYQELEVGVRRQIGFARVVSDCATFAYLTDVLIVDEFRGLGLSKQLMEAIVAHPQLQGLRRFLLVTEDAGGFYAKFGFEPLADVEHWMQIFHE